MTEFRTRVHSVRMKNGGAEVRVLHSPLHETPLGLENLPAKMAATARAMALNDPDCLDGFIIIGLYSDGTRSSSFSTPKRIPREMLPAYVAEIMRTDAVTEWQAENTFSDMFEEAEND